MPVKISEAQQHILDFLKDKYVGVLATANEKGEPHAATIYFAIDDDFNIYFIAKNETQKSINLKTNARAAFAVYEESSQTTLQTTGSVTEVIDNSQTDQVFGKILDAAMSTSESGIPPLLKLKAGNYVFYKFTPSSMRMATYIRPDKGNYEQIFEIA